MSCKATGICLGENAGWVISGLTAFEPFFRHLEQLLPAETAVIYLEGVSIAKDVQCFLSEHSVSACHEIYCGTLQPKPMIYHFPAISEVLFGLADLALARRSSEIANHCHVYIEDGMILQWYDACDLELLASAAMPEERLKAFCERTNASYTRCAKR